MKSKFLKFLTDINNNISCTIENSLIGWKGEINAKAKVKNSFVGPEYKIEAGKTIQNETVSQEDLFS